MKKASWWKQPLRVLQTNLQVMDTSLMDPEKMVRDCIDMHVNALVVNVGGIYAWYPSKVPFHHINEYLNEKVALLQNLIDCCHTNQIRLIARFDFSKAEDTVSQIHPEWFIRNPDGTKRAYGMERPGPWSILYMTCSNGGYRNETVAVPVLQEVLKQYDIDGVFLNAPHYDYCTCQACQNKYEKLYGVPLPIHAPLADGEETYGSVAFPKDVDPRFPMQCYYDNIATMHKAIHDIRPDVPLILYYGIHGEENLANRLETTEMLCTEAQDILSRKWTDIPPAWLPTVIMKYGRSQPNGDVKPFGIIHSCPGMDWRHTGLPTAEYRAWLCQIPAAGGSIWHSITGFCDTVSDKRILRTVTEINQKTTTIEQDMDGAREKSDALLLWDEDKTYGWAELLTDTQTQFDLCDHHQVCEAQLQKYPMVILPDGYALNPEQIAALKNYVRQGGKLVMESTSPTQMKPFVDVMGISASIHQSESLTASYWRFEESENPLTYGLEETPIIAHRGVTAYVQPLLGTRVLATLIPPFAPLNAVGAPPERASMLVSHTDIPLCTVHAYGKGEGLLFPWSFSGVASKHRLMEHFQVWTNTVDLLLGSQRSLQMPFRKGIIANVFMKQGMLLLHLVNGIGSRPLMQNVACTDLSLTLPIPYGKLVYSVMGLLQDAKFTWTQENGLLHIVVERLGLWEMFKIVVAE